MKLARVWSGLSRSYEQATMAACFTQSLILSPRPEIIMLMVKSSENDNPALKFDNRSTDNY